MATVGNNVHLIKPIQRPTTIPAETTFGDISDPNYIPTVLSKTSQLSDLKESLIVSNQSKVVGPTTTCSATLIFDAPTLFPNSLIPGNGLVLSQLERSIWDRSNSKLGWQNTVSKQNTDRFLLRRNAVNFAPHTRSKVDQCLTTMKLNHPRTIRSFNARLNTFAQKGSYNDVLALIEGVQQGQIEIEGRLNTYSYTILLKAYCNSGNLVEAKNLIKEMESFEPSQRPNRFTYNTLLNACVKWDAMESASELFSIMESSGDEQLEPDHVSYTTLIKGFAVNGDMDSAEGLLQRLRNHKDPSFRPNQVTYNTMLKGFAQSGDMAGADRLLALMFKDATCPPDIVSMNTVIGGHARKGDLATAELNFASMKDLMLQPNAVTYHAMIEGHVRIDNMDRAEELFSKIEANGIRDGSATPLTYQAIIGGFARKGDVHKADFYYRRQLLQIDAPTQVTHSLMLGLFASSGNMELAEDIISHLNALAVNKDAKVHATSAMYDQLINGYATLGRMDQAQSIFEEMQQHADRSCHPTRNTFHALIVGFCNAGQRERANEVYEFMLTYPDPNCRPNHTTNHI